MLISTIRSVSPKKLFKNLQFIRSHSVPSLAHFTPYFSDSGSEDLSLDSRSNAPAANFSNNGKNPFEMSSAGVVNILESMQNEPNSATLFFDQLKENGFQHDVQTCLAIIKILCIWGLGSKLDSLLKEVINLEKEHQCFEVSELLEAIAGEIRDGGPSSLFRALDALIKNYVTLGMFDEAIDALFETKRHGVGPCLLSCNFLINSLVGHGKLDTAVAIYKQLKTIGVSPNVYTYGIMIKAYCRNQCLEEATDVLFREMEEAGVAPNAFAYSAYLEGLCMHGKSDLGYEFLLSWKASNAPIDAYAYTVVIQGFVSEKKMKEAENVLHVMEEHGMVPNKVNYRALIQGYCDSGDIIKALTIHNEMEARGIGTNCLVLTAILQCLSQKGMHLEAINQFRNFEKMGIFLDKVAYNVVIDALCKMGKLDEALELFDEMKCKKLTPDVVHYTTLISGYCLRGDISEAVNIFEEMNENGLRADVITYNVLAGGLSRNGLLNEVNLLLGDMKCQGLTPSSVTHNMIIEGLCLGGKVKEAEKYFTNLEDKRIENYASMINGYCESSKAVDGYKLLLRLFNQGIQISRNCCSKLISSLCLEGENDRAIKVFEILLSCEDGPSKMVYHKLIAALCRAGDMKNARWAFDHMIRRGIYPSLILYTIMLNGYCQVNCLKEAHDLFSDMKEKGISPDIITYTVLLDGHSKITAKRARSEKDVEGNKRAKQVALDLLCEMKELDIKPDAVCYTALVDSQCKTDNLQDAISLFNAMKDQGLQPDTVTYTALLSGYCKQGDMKNAETLVDEMKANGIEADSRTVSAFDHGIVRAKKLQLYFLWLLKLYLLMSIHCYAWKKNGRSMILKTMTMIRIERNAVAVTVKIDLLNNDSLDLVGVDSEDCEVVYRPKQRAVVDYIKLYNKLRLVFAENELPERALRVSLSKQLGLEFEKVNKRFKNARYLALKSRKQVENTQEDASPGTQNEPTSESEKADHPDRMMSSDSPKNLKKIASVRKTHLSQTAECNQMTTDPVDGMSLRHLKEKAKESKKKSNCKSIGVGVLEAETEMERLCEIKSRVEKLQQVILQLPSRGRFGKSKKSCDSSVYMYR